MRKIKGLLVDVTRERAVKTVEFEDTLENIYKLLDVECIDVAERKVGEHWYDFVVDDEGLLKDKPIPSILDKRYRAQLVGNVLIVNHNSEGDFISLTDEQIEDLLKHVEILVAESKPTPCIVGVEYE